MSRYSRTDNEDRKFTILNDLMSQSPVPLEDALRPLMDKINRLSYYIKVAKANCCYPSEHGLTRDESAAVFLYTMEWGNQSVYRMVNEALRTKELNIIKPWFQYVKLFITAILKLPAYTGNAWRGENHSITQRFQKNHKCIWWTITSCSLTLDIMDEFIGDQGTFLAIEVKNARSIIGYSYHPQEEEVILLPGTSLQVLNTPFNDCSNMCVVSLKVINEDNLLREYRDLNRKFGSVNVPENSEYPYVCGGQYLNLGKIEYMFSNLIFSIIRKFQWY